MFEIFKKHKTKNIQNEKPITEVKSIFLFPLSIGSNLPLDKIFKGDHDRYWSEILKKPKTLIFDKKEDFESYLNSEDWLKYHGHTRAAVFFLGYSKIEAMELSNDTKFSELVVKASHLHELYSNPEKVHKNDHFNPSLKTAQNTLRKPF
jgi:hypothetical protein